MNKNDWGKAWKTHLDKYLSATPRTGIFIKTLFPGINSTLEVACGSGRDSRYLSRNNIKAIATDYSEELIAELKSRFGSTLEVKCEDAFSMSNNDDDVDLVFSNGFLILFSDNEQVASLVKERFRISKHVMIFIEHNKRNTRQVDVFNKKKQHDEVYNIRFWDPEELKDVVKTILEEEGLTYRKILLLKFGGPWDSLYSLGKKIRLWGVVMRLAIKIVPFLYQLQTWKQTERVAVIVYKERTVS